MLELFQKKYQNLEKAITTIHYLTSYCLYFFDNPVEKFIDITTNGHCEINQKEIISEYTKKEDSLDLRINKIAFVDVEGNKIKIPIGNKFLEQFFSYLHLIYDCRKKLIEKYIKEYQFNFKIYLEKFGELPIPPVIFFSTDTIGMTAKAVTEQSLKDSNRRYYTIVSSDENGTMSIEAGLTTLVNNVDSALPFELINMVLLAQYIFNYIFENGKDEGIFYSQTIDYMYNEIFKKHY